MPLSSGAFSKPSRSLNTHTWVDMDWFTDQDLKNFVNKEWLVRIDNATSRPYLFKFHGPTEGLGRCAILITDTANVWFEALDPRQLARRWRGVNRCPDPTEELASRQLSSLHIQDSVFSIEEARDADLAFELHATDCKWRWECYLLGPKTSANILSTHLILPLISITYLSFTSADPVCELSVEDLQQAVDKVAKTGRRAQHIHVRQIMSRPRVATTLARMTAMFHFNTEPLPPIISELDPDANQIDVDMDAPEAEVHLSPGPATRHAHPHPSSGPSSSTSPTPNTEFHHEPQRSKTRAYDPSLWPDSVLRQKQTQVHAETHDEKQKQALIHTEIQEEEEKKHPQKQKQGTGATEKAIRVLESSSATEPESGEEDALVITSATSPPGSPALAADTPTGTDPTRVRDGGGRDASRLRQVRSGDAEGAKSRSGSERRHDLFPSSRPSTSQPPPRAPTIAHRHTHSQVSDSDSDEVQPRRPSKKARVAVPESGTAGGSDASGDERDSAGGRGTVGRPPAGGAGGARGTGVRQPMKRGGRRF